MIKQLQPIIKGILLAIAVMLVAHGLSTIIPMMGTALIALMLGIIIRQFLPQYEPYQAGVAWSEKYILETAIVLLGFGFEVSRLQVVGGSTFIIIVVSILLIIGLAMVLQRFTKREGQLFWLLGAGSAICGSSAIGATAPLVKAKEEETGISLAVINLLGLLGMVLLPLIARLLHFDVTQTGIFLGGILQSVGHVVGASFAVSDDVGAIATIVKMARISLLLPFLLVVYVLFQRNQSSGPKIQFPRFILLFALTMLLASLDIIPDSITKVCSATSDILFNIGMAAIGLKINLKSIWKISGKSMLYGSILFAFQIIFFIVFLLLK